MAIYARILRDNEQRRLQEWAWHRNDPDMRKRAHVILLSAQGYTVPQISAQVGLHPINVRKWIHRFNTQGLNGLQSGKSPGRPPRFTEEQRRIIVRLAHTDPRSLGLPFHRWSLQRLREYVTKANIVGSISAETIRQILTAAANEFETTASGSPRSQEMSLPTMAFAEQ